MRSRVGIQEDHELAGGVADADIPAVAAAPVLLELDQPQTRLVLCETTENGRRLVG
jgi:hypothetical protein